MSKRRILEEPVGLLGDQMIGSDFYNAVDTPKKKEQVLKLLEIAKTRFNQVAEIASQGKSFTPQGQKKIKLLEETQDKLLDLASQ